MTAREWIDNLDDTDRKGMAAWGIVLGVAVLGSLVPAIGWVFCLLIGLFWFLFIWGIVLYGWLGWLLPERKLPAAKITELTRPQADALFAKQALDIHGQAYNERVERYYASFTPVREQQLARPVPVPDLHKLNRAHRPETRR